MTEDFLHYIWKFRLLKRELYTRSGNPVTIIQPGEHNHDSGPDFLNARIRIGDTTWAGNVEIHVDEGDWFRHNHHLDKGYENVILHVVYDEAKDPEASSPDHCEILVLKTQFPDQIHERYEDFLRNRYWIPCESMVRAIDPVYFTQWSYSLVTERLECKCSQWGKALETARFDWSESLHQRIAMAFGLKVNAIPFELLAKALPLKIVLKYLDNPFSLESLAFGQAGMLDREFSDDHPSRMQKEYGYLAAKHSLQPMDPSLWKFLRLRPTSFPTIRISQWASLIQKSDILFSAVTECRKAEDIADLFSVEASVYWDTHFVFDKLSSPGVKTTGLATVNLIMLNAVAPFLFLYGEYKGINEYKERALSLTEQLPGEHNVIIDCWKKLGFPSGNALYTQALIELKSNYCDRKKCLDCRIGVKLLAREDD